MKRAYGNLIFCIVCQTNHYVYSAENVNVITYSRERAKEQTRRRAFTKDIVDFEIYIRWLQQRNGN